jgi:hypothetical protein
VGEIGMLIIVVLAMGALPFVIVSMVRSIHNE